MASGCINIQLFTMMRNTTTLKGDDMSCCNVLSPGADKKKTSINTGLNYIFILESPRTDPWWLQDPTLGATAEGYRCHSYWTNNTVSEGSGFFSRSMNHTAQVCCVLLIFKVEGEMLAGRGKRQGAHLTRWRHQIFDSTSWSGVCCGK